MITNCQSCRVCVFVSNEQNEYSRRFLYKNEVNSHIRCQLNHIQAHIYGSSIQGMFLTEISLLVQELVEITFKFHVNHPPFPPHFNSIILIQFNN